MKKLLSIIAIFLFLSTSMFAKHINIKGEEAQEKAVVLSAGILIPLLAEGDLRKLADNETFKVIKWYKIRLVTRKVGTPDEGLYELIGVYSLTNKNGIYMEVTFKVFYSFEADGQMIWTLYLFNPKTLKYDSVYEYIKDKHI